MSRGKLFVGRFQIRATQESRDLICSGAGLDPACTYTSDLYDNVMQVSVQSYFPRMAAGQSSQSAQ